MAMLAAKKGNLKFDKIVKLASRVKSVTGRFEKIGTIKNQYCSHMAKSNHNSKKKP